MHPFSNSSTATQKNYNSLDFFDYNTKWNYIIERYLCIKLLKAVNSMWNNEYKWGLSLYLLPTIIKHHSLLRHGMFT
jgi:hypothetical protein